jgi:pimeloyl-ACP methyl ester carboxylesterase
MPTLSRADVTLYYELAGDEHAPAVVYTPGFGAHSNDILATLLIGFLARSGYRILVVDNRGSGQTQTVPDAACTIDLMAEDVAAVMDAVGIHQAHILVMPS